MAETSNNTTTRVDDVLNRVTMLQGNMMDQTRKAIDEYATLGRASVDYSLTMSSQAQQLWLSSARQWVKLASRLTPLSSRPTLPR
ncbi:MAG: hypothetical protein ACI9WU_000287 [Myxococcota bacterium]|jgi:hypothetical protein